MQIQYAQAQSLIEGAIAIARERKVASQSLLLIPTETSSLLAGWI